MNIQPMWNLYPILSWIHRKFQILFFSFRVIAPICNKHLLNYHCMNVLSFFVLTFNVTNIFTLRGKKKFNLLHRVKFLTFLKLKNCHKINHKLTALNQELVKRFVLTRSKDQEQNLRSLTHKPNTNLDVLHLNFNHFNYTKLKISNKYLC